MTGYTSPDQLPYPNDYNAPADVPADVEDLAQKTQEVLTRHAADMQLIAPIGSIVMWPQASAPAGWHLCNGTAHGSDALATVLGSTVTPNLLNRFIVAAGGAYAAGAVGGLDAVTLTEQQSGLRDHAHAAWTAGASIDHAHYTEVGGGDHNHVSSYASQHLQNMDAAGSGFDAMIKTAEWITGGGHGHAAWSGGANQDHSHPVGMNSSGAHPANEAHENRPPYYALTYIIRKA